MEKKFDKGKLIAVLTILGLIGISALAIKLGGTKMDKKEQTEWEEETDNVDTKEFDSAFLDTSLSTLVTQTDDFEDLKFYYSDKMMHEKGDGTYTRSPFDGMYLYLARSGDTITPRVVFLYRGDNWIFFDTVKVKADGTMYEIPLDTSDIKRDTVSGGSVVERCDIVATQEILDIADAIIHSSNVSIRLQGDKSVTYSMNSSDETVRLIEIIADVLEPYQAIMKEME